MSAPEGPHPVVMQAMRDAAEREAQAEVRSWYETEGAIWRGRLGNPLDEGPPMAEVDEQIAAADRHHRRVYGRSLTDRERDVARQGLESRGRRVFHSALLDRPDYDRLGFGYSVEPERADRGTAWNTGDGWRGNPVVADRARELEAERQARDAYLQQTDRTLPGVPRV